MSILGIISDGDLLSAITQVCHGKAGLAAGTNAGTVKTANTVPYEISGLMYSLAATDNIALTATGVQPINTTCIYLLCANAAGTLSTVAGTPVAVGTTAAVVPSLPNTSVAPLGYLTVTTGGLYTFVPGTSSLASGSYTVTYTDVSRIV